jgi:hypothetical protein
MITSILSLALLASFIQFPFETVRACMKGYGDYNWVNEFHTGIDFPAAEGEYSLNPYGETCYSIVLTEVQSCAFFRYTERM